jgi:hypothetical protein
MPLSWVIVLPGHWARLASGASFASPGSGWLVGGFFQLTLEAGDVFFESRHLLVKLVEVSINVTLDNVLMNQAECGLI